jgi:Spy/CpxP family protein refolding chaperone
MSGRRVTPILLSVAASLILMAPSVVQAQEGGGAGGQGGGQSPLAIYQAAGASGDQLSKIQGMGEAFQKAQQARVQVLHGLMKDMYQLSLQPMPDSGAVMAKQDQINKAAADLANEKAKFMLSVRGVLTTPQQQKLVQIMQQQAQQTGSAGGGAQ